MFSNPIYFSTFAALSELVVTAFVLTVMITNLRGQALRSKLLFGTLAYELLVNITYMVQRTVVVAENHPNPLSEWVGVVGALHGVFSLVMFVGLIVVSVLAYRASKRGVAFFQQHRQLTVVFIALWLLSVGSGEVVYFLVYF